MALSTRHRASIYRSLAPLLGDEEADAMVAEFPAREGDELVTRDILRAELAEFRSDMAEFRTDMADRFRRQTVWTTSTMIAGLGLAALIARASG